MRETDPLRFRSIRWTERAVDRWLNLARRRVAEAGGEPARLFESLERDFATTTKWEAQVPMVVTFACLEIVRYDPLAGLQLSLEWGHDTDSYASLVGAFAGALFGASLFDARLREPVADRLKADHGLNLQAESEFLIRLGRHSKNRVLIAVP
jgi:ADP-ribosylglycohydrolase